MGLSTILNYMQSMFIRNGQNGVHFAAFAIKMYHHYGFGLGRYGFFNFLRINIVSSNIRFYQYGFAVGMYNGNNRSYIGIGRDDYFRSLGQFQGPDGQNQCIQSVCNPNAVIHLIVSGKIILKFLNLVP